MFRDPLLARNLPAAHAVEVWWLPYWEPVEFSSAEVILSTDELQRAAQYKVEQARREFMYYRVAMRQCLASYAQITPREVPLSTGPFGKPVWLPEMNGVRVEFNLSHTKSCGLLAVTRDTPVGVDVEYLDPLVDYRCLARDLLSPSEYSEFNDLSATLQPAFLLRRWTCKEAWLKAQAIGLSVLLPEVTMKEASGGIFQAVVASGTQLDVDWSIRSWCPTPNIFAAVAYRPTIQDWHEIGRVYT
jgi:4'-phosphopantetheinyl transferase